MRTRHWNYLAESATRVLDGCIFTIALLEAVEWAALDLWAAILLLMVTLLSVTLAKTYAQVVGVEFARRVAMSWRERGHVFVEMAPIMFSAAAPMIMLVPTQLGLLPVETAVILAQLLLVGVLFALGFLSRRWSGGNLRHSLAVGFLAAMLGLITAEFKVFADSLKR